LPKELLIYEQIVPITSNAHKDCSVKLDSNYEFARTVSSVPLVAAEFPHASADFTIVFTPSGETIVPVAILGLRKDENFYVNGQGGFTAKYVPAFLRRYPFVFSSSDGAETFTLCIDEDFSGCNREGRGERLFDSDGEQTQYLKNVLEFLKEYQAQYKRTEVFCGKIDELGLLEPMSAQFTMANGQKVGLTGFLAIDRDKLKALSGEQLKELAQTDELELMYIHMQSMRNFNSMIDLAVQDSAASTEEKSAEKTAGKQESDKPEATRKTAAKKASRK
jgi:hypothetical protein